MSARDPEGTKHRLMQAARREFAAKGIAGARVDRIVEQAKVNKRMLYHYFGSKDGLFRALLKQRMSERASRMANAQPAEIGRLSRRAKEAVTDRDHIRLMMWEALEATGREPIPDEELRREFYRRWTDRIGDAQAAAGELPDDLDPFQLALAEVSVTLFPVAFPQMTRLITGREADDPEGIADRQRFLDLLEARLDRREPPPATAGSVDEEREGSAPPPR